LVKCFPSYSGSNPGPTNFDVNIAPDVFLDESAMKDSLIMVGFFLFQVNSRNEWDTLMEQFRLPKKCVNSGVALKQVYLR